MPRSTLMIGTAFAFGLGIGALAWNIVPVNAQSANATQQSVYEQLNLFGDVFEKVRSSYVEPVTDEALIEKALNGMLSSLDPHSSYLNAKDFQDMQVQTKGAFGGLGIEITMENGVVKIVTPIDDTPASKAGLQPGDYITHIDGKPIVGLTLNEAVEKMRGEPDSSVKLTILRGQGEPFDVDMKRAIISIKSVRWELLPNNIGYVRITNFSENTDSGLKEAVSKLKDATQNKLSGLIVDLRNNPGGLLDQAIAVSDDFLEKGEIVSTRGRGKEDVQRWGAEKGDLIDGKPLVVLINGGSASASEIVSGALQDHHRAVLLGTKSFGKGSVQSIVPIPGHGAIRLTTARYYTPSGRSIQAKGIEPDIEVKPSKITELEPGRTYSEADLAGAIENKGGTNSNEGQTPANATPNNAAPNNTPAEQKPAHIGSEKEPITKPAEDYQLSRGMDLLRGLSIIGDQAKQ